MLHIMLLAFNKTYVSKKLHSKNNLKEVKNKMEIAKERFISPEEGQVKLLINYI